jgi:signal transduction histidine kinase
LPARFLDRGKSTLHQKKAAREKSFRIRGKFPLLTPQEEIFTAVSEPTRALVLVVDDEYGPRESIAYTLATEFAVETAERAAEALKKIKATQFATVVMDIRMPEMDGIRAVEELRKIDPLVSVIMLTGYGTLATAQQAMVAGANQYLRKPPDVAELLTAVRQQVQATKLRRHHAKLVQDALNLNLALKQEIERTEPQVWQARASVELVHDLNNPLTVVIGYASLLMEESRHNALKNPGESQKLLDYANMVGKAAEYCHHLSENWRVASKNTATFRAVDLVEVAREVKQVLFFGNAAIHIRGEAQAIIRGSKYELMRIFQNFYKNGLESGATALTVTFADEGESFGLVLADNGPGMDAERLRRALHGGFSSKATGTGLGLSICRHLVSAHGGSFAMESTVGVGTTVRLKFPKTAAAAGT